jgi:SAM-dependent methyltransferase
MIYNNQPLPLPEVDYDHNLNLHSFTGPLAAVPILLKHYAFSSLLDVGCGTGSWLAAAVKHGVSNVFGVDGVAALSSRLHIPTSRFQQVDFRSEWDLGMQFDAALCLEVAEHLPSNYEANFIKNLVKHSSLVFFSAAPPGQSGQNHVNCHWPEHWQALFNDFGYECSDLIRWALWDISEIEPWYRQNLFVAFKSNRAGSEARIKKVVHPEMMDWHHSDWSMQARNDALSRIERGGLPMKWYVLSPFKALVHKFKRRVFA